MAFFSEHDSLLFLSVKDVVGELPGVLLQVGSFSEVLKKNICSCPLMRSTMRASKSPLCFSAYWILVSSIYNLLKGFILSFAAHSGHLYPYLMDAHLSPGPIGTSSHSVSSYLRFSHIQQRTNIEPSPLFVDHREVVDGVIAFFRDSVDATENRMGRPLFEAVPLAFAGDTVDGHCEAYENFKHVEPLLCGF